jgi:sugar/nucleoside kinase (ribokinase family)
MNAVCVGDCGVDRYVPLGIDRPGGITLNFAVHFRQCLPDARVSVCTAVGTDEAAELVTAAIARAGLVPHLRRLPGRTPIQYIDIEPSGEKRFIEYDAGVLTQLRLNDEERAIVATSDLLVTTVFAQVEALFDSVMSVPLPGLRAVDFTNLSDVGDGVGLVSRYVEQIDVAFFGLASTQEELIEALEQVARRNGRLFVVTLGPDGSMALGGSRRIVQAAHPVPRVVDTTGAGDSFAAGFLAEYCTSRDVAQSLARGSDEAARTIQHIGGFLIAD